MCTEAILHSIAFHMIFSDDIVDIVDTVVHVVINFN